MNVNCRKTCGVCDSGPCADSFKDCRSIAREKGSCQTAFMRQSCRLTCGLCEATAGGGVARGDGGGSGGGGGAQARARGQSKDGGQSSGKEEL